MNILHLLHYHKPMTDFTIARNLNRDVKLPVFYIFWTGTILIKRYRNPFCTRSMGTAQHKALFLIGCSTQQWRACPLCRQPEFWEATPLLTHVTLLQRACLASDAACLARHFWTESAVQCSATERKERLQVILWFFASILLPFNRFRFCFRFFFQKIYSLLFVCHF